RGRGVRGSRAMAGSQPELRAVFCAALDCQSLREQGEYLERACEGKPELRARVEALLRANQEAAGFLQEPAVARAGPRPAVPEPPGTAVGPYRLPRLLGEGGMGAVWMAEQTNPVQRRVALKIIKPGMDSPDFLARFEAERQALALMDHPHIARVFDGGTTDEGRPYFAMELVQGTL